MYLFLNKKKSKYSFSIQYNEFEPQQYEQLLKSNILIEW
jgi:hypothetical protein